MKLWGIKNCDSVRKALKRLTELEQPTTFICLRSEGINRDTLKLAIDQLGIEKVVNKRSTTWKQRSEEQKARLLAADLDEILAEPTIIKRPLIEYQGKFYIGTDESLINQITSATA
ncbi:ArsC/Spx/MgsR family protein [uncultured Umboniibacter sp.]|uniref:ArsC/Spx/MgsR family protein n=1 Tax=uncultured Umboniibacter sp. TaxID=1798917 RepID=UPI00262C96FA|nr:ArsC/Spx/MgsR family protein [uncultured Umboniibacter sp.]